MRSTLYLIRQLKLFVDIGITVYFINYCPIVQIYVKCIEFFSFEEVLNNINIDV